MHIMGLRKPDNVAQPPSAGDVLPSAKPSPGKYRRNLPHIHSGEKPIYITFCTKDRWAIPEPLRSLVVGHCLHDHARKYWLHCVVVMPDHVHMILTLCRDVDGNAFGLPEIMHGIKGASAHSINRALGRKGSVWQDESFDHVLRSTESLSAKAEYVRDNPIRKGLAREPGQWPWFWADWMNFENSTAEGGCAT